MKHLPLTLLSAFSIFCLGAMPMASHAQDNTPQNNQELERLPQDEFAPERIKGSKPAARAAGTQQVLIPAGLLYASFDSNADYAVSEQELAAGIERSFGAADSNNNGTLSLVELANWRERVLGSRDVLPGNTQFDKNFDSSIARSEFQTVLMDIYKHADRDESGALEFAELTRPLAQRRQGGGEKAGGRQSGGQRGGQRGGGRGGGRGR